MTLTIAATSYDKAGYWRKLLQNESEFAYLCYRPFMLQHIFSGTALRDLKKSDVHINVPLVVLDLSVTLSVTA